MAVLSSGKLKNRWWRSRARIQRSLPGLMMEGDPTFWKLDPRFWCRRLTDHAPPE